MVIYKEIIVDFERLMCHDYLFQVSVPKAKEVCQYSWMKEALDLLVTRLESTPSSNL